VSASVVARAQEAAAQGAWDDAFGLLAAQDAEGTLDPAALPLLGEVAYAAGHLDATIAAWERAHTAALAGGDDRGAAGAAVRVAMHLLFDTALMAPVRGWLARAERLLAGEDDNPPGAWLAVVRAYERLLSGDPAGAQEAARRAVEVGAVHDAAACAVGRVADARLRILAGEVEDGLALLDDAGAAAVSGTLDALSTGVVYCELVCALQGLAQYDVAEQWTQAMERWSAGNAIGSLHGRCRVHRAEILRLRGACDEAEREALAACEELRPYLRRELGWPLSELGRIRLLKGDLAGAEDALVAAHRAGWDPQPGLALLRLAQGDAAAAAASVADALEHPLRVPSKELPPNTELRRAPLLAAQVEIEAVAGDLERARSAADELEAVAATFRSEALRATAALARGRVRLAEGDAAGAQRHLAEAARLWADIGAPHEAAAARRALAGALRATGDDHRAGLEEAAARAILEGLGIAGDDVSGIATFAREGDHWLVVFEGRALRVRDLKGIRHLACLVGRPGRDVHVLDLVAMEDGAVVLGDAGEVLDAQAKQAYRRRLAEIEDDLEQARAMADPERAAQAEAERDFLVRELAAAVGLGGRDRRAASASERARVSVTRAVRRAIASIAEHDPGLGEHLARTVRTGTSCAYVPDGPA
jgi:tetratricopeptide (TPR) repeat protein